MFGQEKKIVKEYKLLLKAIVETIESQQENLVIICELSNENKIKNHILKHIRLNREFINKIKDSC